MTTAELEYVIKVQDRELKDLQKQLKGTSSAFDDSEKSGGK